MHIGYIFGGRYGSVLASLKEVIITGGMSIGSFSDCSGLTSVTIPDSVTSIGDYTFSGCSGLISFTIPDGVTGIGDRAFLGCTGLTSITIPDSVTSMGISAFGGCSSLESITLPFVGATKDGTSNTLFGYIFGASHYSYNKDYVPALLKEVVITGGTDIGQYAFDGCSGLTSITIPDCVASIGDGERAFYDCSGLTSITIPDSVTSIGSYAFAYCDGLTSVTIPDSVTSIVGSAFNGCTGLTSIVVEEGNSVYHSAGNCLIETASKTLTAGCKTSAIPDDYSVTSIGGDAFSGCVGLTSITIPDGVTNIGSSAFRGCTGLTSITIPDSVTNIWSSAFSGCSGLTSIVVEEGNSVYHSAGNCLIKTASRTLIAGCKTSAIPDDYSVTDIGDYAFSGCVGLTSITIPDSVTSIGWYAFDGCTGLTSVTIPDSVTWIGDYAFFGCSGLTSINIPDGVTSIGLGTFYGCSSLTSITIPDSVTSIGEHAFWKCTGLTSVTFEGTVAEWNAINKSSSWNEYCPFTEVVCSDGTVSV